MFQTTKGWHPGLTNGGSCTTDDDTIAAIRDYWNEGESSSAIAVKLGVSSSTVMRYVEDLPPHKKEKPLSPAEISGLLRGW